MTDGEPETEVSASLQKIKSIKNPIKHFLIYFYLIKSETSDSFVNHFDGYFAYLKTMDFYFKRSVENYSVNWCGLTKTHPFSDQGMEELFRPADPGDMMHCDGR